MIALYGQFRSVSYAYKVYSLVYILSANQTYYLSMDVRMEVVIITDR